MDDPAERGARAQTTSPEGFIQKGTRDKRRMTEEPCEVETLTHGFEAEAGGVIPSSTVTVGREAATQCWVEQASGRSRVSKNAVFGLNFLPGFWTRKYRL